MIYLFDMANLYYIATLSVVINSSDMVNLYYMTNVKLGLDLRYLIL